MGYFLIEQTLHGPSIREMSVTALLLFRNTHPEITSGIAAISILNDERKITVSCEGLQEEYSFDHLTGLL